jgi:hypothetical protein
MTELVDLLFIHFRKTIPDILIHNSSAISENREQQICQQVSYAIKYPIRQQG